VIEMEYKLEKFVENTAFRKFAPYFLDKPRTIIEVAKLSGVTRQTISNIIKKSPKTKDGKYKYFITIDTEKWRPYTLKLDVLIDYMCLRLNLDGNEKALIKENLTGFILNFITEDNQKLDTALMKVISLTLFLCAANDTLKADPRYLKQRKKNFKNIEFLFGTINDDKIKKIEEYYKKNYNSLENIKQKIKSSNFTVSVSTTELYDMTLSRIGGVAWDTRQKELWGIK
jgi:predicted transcriptional regulator